MILFVRMIKTESGEGEVNPIEDNNEDNVKIKDRPFPNCGVVTSSGELPTWTDLLKGVEKTFKKTANSLKSLQGDVDPTISLFIELQLASLFEQIFSCLPQFISHPEGSYEDYMEDEVVSEKPAKDDEVVTFLINKVKLVMEKVKKAIRAGYENWETKDSILLLFTTPGLLSAVILLLKICLKNKVKKYSQELQDRNRR